MFGAKLLGRLRRAADHSAGPDETDAALLARFAAARDGEAFAELVRRHGPMVRRVCHGVLGNHADADDAFQAAFLVLARKAGVIRERHTVANWLFGVARRVAARARDKERRRERHESRAGAERDTQTDAHEVADLRPVLDAELERLPDRFRAAVVVCLVQGRTQEDAARELGWSLSTLRRRLERGRDLLRARLARRGLGAAGVAALGGTPLASIGADVIEATRRAACAFGNGEPTAASAARLAEGVLAMMARNNIRNVAAVVLAGGLIGGGVVWQLASASQGQGPAAKVAPSAVGRPAAKDEKKQPDPATKEPAADRRIRAGDRLDIVVPMSFVNSPIKGVYRVEASGSVPLGPDYGRVAVSGMTVEEAEKAIGAHLKRLLVDPTTQVTFAEETDEPRLRALEERVKQLEKTVDQLRQAIERRK